MATVITESPIRSTLDNRSYCLTRLPNDLDVQWVHNPDAEKASVVMTVPSGWLNDGSTQGIGHATEHLLTMGSVKYRSRSELKQRIEKYRGHTNAFTDIDHTMYYFQITINPKTGEELLDVADVLFQAFIKPGFEPENVEDELVNIESEYLRALPNDRWKVEQVQGSVCNPAHPWSSSFGCGNRESLGEPAVLLARVSEHHKKYYSARLMKCVVSTPRPISWMRESLEGTLSEIPNTGASEKDWGHIPLYRAEDLGEELFVKSIQDLDNLMIDFFFPGKKEAGYSARGGYMADLIAQEGEGSITALLLSKQLINSLYAGTSYQQADSWRLTVDLKLTKTGAAKPESVVLKVLQFIARVCAEEPQRELAEERARMKQKRFCTHGVPDLRHAMNIGQNMLLPHLKAENFVYGDRETRAADWFDAELIKANASLLRPKNMRLTFQSQKALAQAPAGQPMHEEKWTKTQWWSRKILPDHMDLYCQPFTVPADQLPPTLHPPAPNRFLTKRDFESEMLGRLPGEPAQQAQGPPVQGTKPPRALRLDDQVELWYYKAQVKDLMHFRLWQYYVRGLPVPEIVSPHALRLPRGLAQKSRQVHRPLA
ncbi:Metalloenzyme, LuxS/M16 peptidase-like protein [Diaporthe sp. PMI_573]|nr:Metalloenzyme, LuxS/M16 peptidase-like protein [Diaporthaceae sp. PMI_573]